MHRLLLIAAFSLPVLVSEEVLEPSVLNEVDHAISVAEQALASETNAPGAVISSATNAADGGCLPTNIVGIVEADVFGTNTLTATAIALKLVTTQQADGRWRVGTNDVTEIALEILKSL